jgi:hypothetical protein
MRRNKTGDRCRYVGTSLGDRALWLGQPKSIPFSDELYDLADIGISLKILFKFLDPLLQRAAFTKQLIDHLLHGLDLASQKNGPPNRGKSLVETSSRGRRCEQQSCGACGIEGIQAFR